MLGWAIKLSISSFLKRIEHSLDSLVKCVEALNIKIAVVIQQVSSHEKRIESAENVILSLRKRTHDLGNTTQQNRWENSEEEN